MTNEAEILHTDSGNDARHDRPVSKDKYDRYHEDSRPYLDRTWVPLILRDSTLSIWAEIWTTG